MSYYISDTMSICPFVPFAAKDARAVQDVDVAALRARLRADGQRFE